MNPPEENPQALPPRTASELSLVSCNGCDLVVRAPGIQDTERALCPRCGARLHSRKAHSLERTWAFLIGATILYVPANLLPVMTTFSGGWKRSDTIMSGITHLFHLEMWPLAMVVFFASIVIPLLKLLVLSYLVVSVQLHSRRRPAHRTRIYRVIEKIGRWSMVDIYAITILVALVKFGTIARVEVEPGALFFGAVVVITMLAAESFDPRLIWDRCA
jgi:paraquat-inducible protein A